MLFVLIFSMQLVALESPFFFAAAITIVIRYSTYWRKLVCRTGLRKRMPTNQQLQKMLWIPRDKGRTRGLWCLVSMSQVMSSVSGEIKRNGIVRRIMPEETCLLRGMMDCAPHFMGKKTFSWSKELTERQQFP